MPRNKTAFTEIIRLYTYILQYAARSPSRQNISFNFIFYRKLLKSCLHELL